MIIKAVWPSERAKEHVKLRNAWGGAPLIWDALQNKYFPGTQWLSPDENKSLWSLVKNTKIPESYRAVMLMTYDGALIFKADYKKAAQDIKKFFADFPCKPGYPDHWPKIADIFDSAPDFPAIGFYWTSCGDDFFQGEFDEEKDEMGPINWGNTFNVYKELKRKKNRSK